MPMCKHYGVAFSWGNENDKWIPLIPVGEEAEAPRTFQDENGVLRAHHEVCTRKGGPTVRITKLARSVLAKDIIGAPLPVLDPLSGIEPCPPPPEKEQFTLFKKRKRK